VAAADGFEIVGSKAVIDVGFLTVETLEMRVPNGRVIERIAVRHPGAVAVLPIDGDDLILIRQFRAPIGQALLEVPAGKLDVAGEPPQDSAMRELEEEIGMRPGHIESVFRFFTTPGFTNEEIELFVATELVPGSHTPHGAEEEAAEIVRVPLEKVGNLLASGQVTDAKTLIALQWLQLHR